MEYIHPDKYDESRLNEVLALDNIVYDKKYRGSFKSVSQRYKTNEKMFIFAVDEKNKMCGYICFFPVSSGLAERVEHDPVMADDNIEPKDVVQYDKNCVNNIFIISVAVFPEYRRMGVGYTLIKEMFAFLSKMSVSGYEIGKIYAVSTSPEGKKALVKCNFEKCRSYDSNTTLFKYDFICYEKMDLYLFLPVSLTEKFVRVKASNPFLEKLNETSRMEVNSLMNERINRAYIGKIDFLPEDDYGNAEKGKILEAGLYLSSYRNIGTLTVEFRSISFDPTFVLDQASRGSLKVTVNGAEQLLIGYLSQQGLEVLGNCTFLLASAEKLNPYYRQYVLFAEAYFSRMSSKIISEEAKEFASTNIAQYEFAEIYCSGIGVSFEFDANTPSSTYQERLETSIFMVYISEMLSLQIASLKLVQNTVTKEFDQSPKPSLGIIENLIESFGKYMVLFDFNYKYYLAKILSDKVAERLGIFEMRKNYEATSEQLNKIIAIKSERLNKEFSKKQDNLFKVISVFTLLLSINNVLSFIIGADFSNTASLVVFIVSIAFWAVAMTYLLVVWLKNRFAKRQAYNKAKGKKTKPQD